MTRHLAKTCVFLFSLMLFFSCAGRPKNEVPQSEDSSNIIEENDEEYIYGEGGTTLIPGKRSRVSYFYTISTKDKNILEYAEDGSPESLRKAYSLLKGLSSDAYEENELTLMQICSSIMAIAWPSENALQDMPSAAPATPYTMALDSVERGVYDESVEKNDFFLLVLPSLAVLKGSLEEEYCKTAKEDLALALEYSPDSALANYLMGKICTELNLTDEALAAFAKAEKKLPLSQEVHYAKAYTLFNSHQYEEALRLGETLLGLYPQNIQALELCCDAAYNLGDYTRAEGYVTRILQRESENMHFSLVRARILMARGDYIKVSSILDIYSRNSVLDKDYLLLRAQLQRDWNKNNAAAGETIGRALAYYAEDEEVLLFAAQVASALGAKVGGFSARELAERVLAKNPEQEQALEICIAELGKEGEWQSAYDMSRTLTANPEVSKKALHTHIDVCLALEKTDEAWALADKLYAESPSDEDAQQSYVKVLVSSGRRARAAEVISALLPSSSTKMRSFLYYQKSLLDTDSETILSDLRSSLTANPRNRDSLYRLYRIYYNRQDWRRAQYYLKQVVALDSSDSSVLALDAELDGLINK